MTAQVGSRVRSVWRQGIETQGGATPHQSAPVRSPSPDPTGGGAFLHEFSQTGYCSFMAVIANRRQLAQLPGVREAIAPGKPQKTVQRHKRSAQEWRIPAPENGVSYSAAEVATIFSVTESTVRDWRCRGLQVGRRRVRLQTLRVGRRGHVAPPALCEFMSRVNDLTVVVQG